MSVESKVRRIISDQAGVKLEEVKLDRTSNQLGMDSLDDIEVIMAIEEDFNIEIPDDKLRNGMTVQDMVDLVGIVITTP